MVKKLYKKLISSQLRVNMASGVVCTLFNTAALMVGYPLFLHYLGFELYGVWLVLATVLTFAHLGDLGINVAITKLVAEEFGRGNIREIQRYVTSALAVLCVSGGLILIVLLAFKGHIVAIFNLSDEHAEIALWLLPYIGTLSVYVLLIQVLQGTLEGLGRMDQSNYIQTAQSTIKVVIAASMLASGFGLISLLVGSIISHICVHLLCLVFIRRIAPIRILRLDNVNFNNTLQLLRFGGTLFGGTIIMLITKPLINVLISRYAGVASLPIYEIAFQSSMKVRALFEVALRAIMPDISRLSSNFTEEARQRILRIYQRSLKLTLLLGIPFYLMLVAISPWLLQVWLRESFTEALPTPFRIMLLATSLSLFGVPAYYGLMGIGKIRNLFVARSITWILCLFIIIATAVSTSNLSVIQVTIIHAFSWLMSTSYMIAIFTTTLNKKALILNSPQK